MVLTLASVLTLVQILNGLGGAGVAINTLVNNIKGTHKSDDALAPEHITALKTALVNWAPPEIAATMTAAQDMLRLDAGALREHADQLDIIANALSGVARL